mgnify:CR=1 FL=1
MIGTGIGDTMAALCPVLPLHDQEPRISEQDQDSEDESVLSMLPLHDQEPRISEQDQATSGSTGTVVVVDEVVEEPVFVVEVEGEVDEVVVGGGGTFGSRDNARPRKLAI